MIYFGTVLGVANELTRRKERTNGTGLHGRQERAVYYE